ncbi:hypothetical protein WBP06_19340 [Novosphingobium sp. BL-8H]|uniref:hypothetical protein n=1 Tax=Novosphingobium sp. BL-8H TaxID=3127640 RepID=UPI003757463B
MEKIIYVLWKNEIQDSEEFNRLLLGDIRSKLLDLPVKKLQLNVVDDIVAPGAPLRAEPIRPMPSAMISFWLNAAHERSSVEAILNTVAPRIAGYAVAESTVLPNTEDPDPNGRVRGFSQLAFLFKLPEITREGFMEIWMRDQTRVGVETQDTFYYCQNVITRMLTPGAPAWDGIVEECYPIEAMTDPLVFWKANGSEEIRQANFEREMANVARFLDLPNVAVMITSAYRADGWKDPAPLGGAR